MGRSWPFRRMPAAAQVVFFTAVTFTYIIFMAIEITVLTFMAVILKGIFFTTVIFTSQLLLA